MINGMILTQSIYNENYSNEDFTLKLLIENAELESKLFVLNEGENGGGIKSKLQAFIKMIKKLKDRFIKFIKDKINKFNFKLSKTKGKENQDVEIKKITYDFDNLKNILDTFTKMIHLNDVDTIKNFDFNFDKDGYEKYLCSILKIDNVSDIDNINMIEMEKVKGGDVNVILTKMKYKLSELNELQKDFGVFCDTCIEDCQNIMTILSKIDPNSQLSDRMMSTRYTSLKGVHLGLSQNEKEDKLYFKMCDIIMQKMNIAKNIILKISYKVISSITEVINYNTSVINGKEE